MSAEQQYITNPITKRPVKIGSRKYNKLISDGILGIKKENENERVLFTIEKDDNRSVENIKEELYKRRDIDPEIHSIKLGKKTTS